MSESGKSSPLINSISEFDLVLSIARKHGIKHLRVGDIEAVIGDLPEPMKAEPATTRSDDVTTAQIDAEAQLLYRSI